ncbi:unnamed protein product, partial [Heterosigma akashiwo]
LKACGGCGLHEGQLWNGHPSDPSSCGYQALFFHVVLASIPLVKSCAVFFLLQLSIPVHITKVNWCGLRGLLLLQPVPMTKICNWLCIRMLEHSLHSILNGTKFITGDSVVCRGQRTAKFVDFHPAFFEVIEVRNFIGLMPSCQ